MPHTNRARRADHYRSIDNTRSSKGSYSYGTPNKTGDLHGGNGGVGRSTNKRDVEDGADPHDPYTERRAAVGGDSRGAGSGQHRGAAGRGSAPVGGGEREADNRTGPTRKTKTKVPSVKNQMRSLKRLMNKPVSA